MTRPTPLQLPSPHARSSVPTPPWCTFSTPSPIPNNANSLDGVPYHRQPSPPFFGGAGHSFASPASDMTNNSCRRGVAVGAGSPGPCKLSPHLCSPPRSPVRSLGPGGGSVRKPSKLGGSKWHSIRGSTSPGMDLVRDESSIFMLPSEFGTEEGVYYAADRGLDDSAQSPDVKELAAQAEAHLTVHPAKRVTVISECRQTLVRTLTASDGDDSGEAPATIDVLERQLDWLDSSEGGMLFDKYRCVPHAPALPVCSDMIGATGGRAVCF